jgi:hypothetical protein
MKFHKATAVNQKIPLEGNKIHIPRWTPESAFIIRKPWKAKNNGSYTFLPHMVE